MRKYSYNITKKISSLVMASMFILSSTAVSFADVRDSKLENMANEGVICKGAPLKKGFQPHMFKIKSYKWLKELREKCKTEEEFQKLV